MAWPRAWTHEHKMLIFCHHLCPSTLVAKQVQAIQKFVTNRNLPERLKEDITRYVESSAVIRSEHGHQEDVFSLLSHTLQAGRTPRLHCVPS